MGKHKARKDEKHRPRPQDTSSGHRSPCRVETSGSRPHLEFSIPENTLLARRPLPTAGGGFSFSLSLVSPPFLLFRAAEVLLALLSQLGQSSQKDGAEEELELDLERIGVVVCGGGGGLRAKSTFFLFSLHLSLLFGTLLGF